MPGATQLATVSGIADTLLASGRVVSAGADALIAQLAAPPKGDYLLRVYVALAAGAAADAGNMNLKAGAVTLVDFLPYSSQNISVVELRRALDGAAALQVRSVGVASAGAVYIAIISALQIG